MKLAILSRNSKLYSTQRLLEAAAMLGTGPTFAASFEESTDQDSWTTCTNGGGGDPGAGTEVQYQPEFSKRWFRIKVTLGGTAPAATCWAIGFLEMRER